MQEPIRIICKVEIKGPNLVKGISFEGQRVLGSPESFIDHYNNNGADEIYIQDTVASLYERPLDFDFIRSITKNVNIPVIVGGGIKNIEEIKMALRSGADKVAINSYAIKDSNFLREAISIFGSQCIVSSIEAMHENNQYILFYEYGRQNSHINLIKWVEEICEIGVGEIILTSVTKDGTMSGLDLNLGKIVNSICTMPLILSGGFNDFREINKAYNEYDLKNFAISKSLHYNLLKSKKFIENLIENYQQILRGNSNFDIGNKEFLKKIINNYEKIEFTTFDIIELKKELEKNDRISVRI